MSNRQSLKEKFNNCFLDLQRSAVSFYLNPNGKTHQVFLKHARKSLAEIKNKKAREFSARIFQMEKKTAHHPRDKKRRINLADEILTLGCLLK
jgi:hypothetical protein